MTEIVLYIHIPFCRARCDYCDFFTRTRVPAYRQVQIVERTISHAVHVLHQLYTPGAPISSIYIGGGTPSSVHEDARHRLLQGMKRCIDFGTLNSESEITVEVNPEDINVDLLREFEMIGVNRLSLGVQSLHTATLSRIGRHTTLSTTRSGLELIAGTWPHRWSVDLITAIPGRHPMDSAGDAQNILQFRPHHVSLYELSIEPGTRLALTQRRGVLPADPERRRLTQLRTAAEVLVEAGLHRYEISSFASPGDESRHNMAYWRMRPWAAAGPGSVALLPDHGQAAHFTTGRRFQEYLNRNDYAVTVEPLTPIELCEEYFMGGFRMTRGVSNTSIRSVFGRTVQELIPETLDAWSHRVQPRDDTFVTLTDTGRLFLNRFLVDAFGELDRSGPVSTVQRWPPPNDDASIDATAT